MRLSSDSLAGRSPWAFLLGCHEVVKHVQVPPAVVLQGTDGGRQTLQQLLVGVCEYLVGVCCMMLHRHELGFEV